MTLCFAYKWKLLDSVAKYFKFCSLKHNEHVQCHASEHMSLKAHMVGKLTSPR